MFKKEVTFGQLLVIAAGFLTTTVTAWIALTNAQARLEVRVDTLEKKTNKIEDKLDVIQNNTTIILAKLEQQEANRRKKADN